MQWYEMAFGRGFARLFNIYCIHRLAVVSMCFQLQTLHVLCNGLFA